MEKVNNEPGDQEVKMEAKSPSKPGRAPKTSAAKADAAKAGTAKARAPKTSVSKADEANTLKVEAAGSKINDVRFFPGDEQEANSPACNADEGSGVNAVYIAKEDLLKNEYHAEEIKDVAKEAAKGEKKKKNAGKRKLCKLVKKDFLKKHVKEYEELVLNPRYICGKCGRAAKDAKSLCRPIPVRP